jgi:hypothetical protein
MADRRTVDRAIADIEKELAHKPQPQYAERSWFTRVRAEKCEHMAERDWSGASWAGSFAGGRNWSGGRDR